MFTFVIYTVSLILFFRQFRTVDDVLKGARHMVAMQIAHDPQVRQAVREIFSDRCKICIQPTKKGIKVCFFCLSDDFPLKMF